MSGYLRSGANYLGAESSHAWVSVSMPGTGWLRFDPTNDVTPSEGHVTPVKGIALGGGGQNVEVEVRVRRAADACRRRRSTQLAACAINPLSRNQTGICYSLRTPVEI